VQRLGSPREAVVSSRQGLTLLQLVHSGCLAELDHHFCVDRSRRLLTVLRWLPSKRGDHPPRRFSFAPAVQDIRTRPRAYCWTSSVQLC